MFRTMNNSSNQKLIDGQRVAISILSCETSTNHGNNNNNTELHNNNSSAVSLSQWLWLLIFFGVLWSRNKMATHSALLLAQDIWPYLVPS